MFSFSFFKVEGWLSVESKTHSIHGRVKVAWPLVVLFLWALVKACLLLGDVLVDLIVCQYRVLRFEDLHG